MKRITLAKPVFVKAKTKSELMNKITESGTFHTVFGSMGKGRDLKCLESMQDRIRVYNIHKVRPKKDHTHTKVVREGGWYGYVYTFDRDTFRGMKKFSLIQKTRHFDLFVEL